MVGEGGGGRYDPDICPLIYNELTRKQLQPGRAGRKKIQINEILGKLLHFLIGFLPKIMIINKFKIQSYVDD